MDIFKFTLEGKTAFFKKPDVNSYLYFTYNNIHKVALLGIFGAILGYDGYNQMSFSKKYKKDFNELNDKKNFKFPQFYNKLNHVKVAIEPKEAIFKKKVQLFNNSVGYASSEKGGNLIINEQWLENPSWDIYILINDEETLKIKESIGKNEYKYIPYLGKNDHFADILNFKNETNVNTIDNPKEINSLFKKNDFELSNKKNLFDEVDDLLGNREQQVNNFKYEEKLPVKLEEKTNKYEFESFIFTNMEINKKSDVRVYGFNNKNIVFF